MVMNAETRYLSNGFNSCGITDIKKESHLFDQQLDAYLKSGSKTKPLLCFPCNLQFCSYSKYLYHHIQHVASPTIALSPLSDQILKCLFAGTSGCKRPGPKSKTRQQYFPLKLTIKRQPTCHEPASKVVCKKKGRAAMDEMIQAGQGGLPTNPQGPGPTASDILSQEVNADSDRSTWESLAYSFGFLAPEPLETPAIQEGGDEAQTVNGKSPVENGNPEDSGSSSSGEPEPPPFTTSLPTPSEAEVQQPAPDELPQQNGVSDMDSESEHSKNVEQESSDSGCEKDESEKDFVGFDKDPETTTPPTNPSPVGGLTILPPSALNSTLPPEPLDSNTVTETLSNINNESSSPAPPNVKSPAAGLTILSPAALGATSGRSVNLLNINTSSNDPLGMLRGYMDHSSSYMLETCEVCGDRSENLELHRSTMGHYKCHLAPECSIVLFTSAMELSNHQHVAHGVLNASSPPATTSPHPPPQQSLQQLAQQVQRLPATYGVAPGVSTPPPSGSPSYRVPGGITLTYPTTTGQPAPLPFQGGIQARPFAMQTSPSTMRPDGSPCASPSLPSSLGRSISISPSTKLSNKRSTSSPAPAVETSKRSRPESPDCEFVDVQQKMPNLPSSISLTVRDSPKNKESSGVANILASRGITVTPATNKGGGGPVGNSGSSGGRSTGQPVTTLNLSSAVSIVPASQSRSQFAVPQGRSVGRQVDRNVRPPTVDLTQDSTPVFNRRNRPQRFICQVCDKVFTTQDTLNQHLTTHRSPGKLPYKCSLCNAQYPTHQGLLQHKQTYHKEAQGSEMALPVVDIKHPGTIQKLSSLGVRHCLVLSQLTNSSGGVFGLPIVAMDSARNPAICNLAALGASNVLSLGPAKALR